MCYLYSVDKKLILVKGLMQVIHISKNACRYLYCPFSQQLSLVQRRNWQWHSVVFPQPHAWNRRRLRECLEPEGLMSLFCMLS